MDDVISRQLVMKTLCERRCGDKPKGCPSGFCTESLAVDCIPSAKPAQQWIPCSERLPEKDGRYQVTRYDYVANTEFTDILWYEENLWWNRHSTGDYTVTAWMPLPEPYQESEQDE